MAHNVRFSVGGSVRDLTSLLGCLLGCQPPSNSTSPSPSHSNSKRNDPEEKEAHEMTKHPLFEILNGSGSAKELEGVLKIFKNKTLLLLILAPDNNLNLKVEEDREDRRSGMKRDMKIRVNTVGALPRKPKSPYRPVKLVPFIRLSGLWLKNTGFNIGEKFEVHPGKKQLLLKTIDDCVDNCNPIEKGGKTNG
jgi:hypothetical protein